MKTTDREALIAAAHGVKPSRPLTDAEQFIWTEAQSSLIGPIETHLEWMKEKDLPSRPLAKLAAKPADWPRRGQMLEWTPIEAEIHGLIQRVEALGADILLTKVITLLGESRHRLADWLEQDDNAKQPPT